MAILETSKDQLTGRWSYAQDITSLQNIEICHHYSFHFKDDNTGFFGFSVHYLEANEMKLLYRGTTAFSFRPNEDGDEKEAGSSILNNISVDFEEFVFRPITISRIPFDKDNYPPILFDHIEEMEKLISDQIVELEYNVEGRNNLIVKGFPIIKNRSFMELRRQGSWGQSSCDHE